MLRSHGALAGARLPCPGRQRAASAQSWPTQPVRWIVPYPAGGGTDVVARTVASGLEKALGQTIVVENRPGAGTLIGAPRHRAGRTLRLRGRHRRLRHPGVQFLALRQAVVRPGQVHLHRRHRQVPAVAGRADINTRRSRPIGDVLAAAKKEPGKLTAASAGAGSPHHLALELFKQRTGADVLHVPYKGAAPAIQDLLGGQVDLMFIDLASGLPNVKAGKLRVLASATPERLPVLPDTPTMAQQGVANFTAYAWQGLVGPAGVPESVVKKLSADLDATLKNPAVSQKILDMGVVPMPMSAEELHVACRPGAQRLGGSHQEGRHQAGMRRPT